jgi:hypothetical protein
MVNFRKRDKVAELSGSRLLIRSIVSLALIALVASGWAWWHFVYSNPKRVFWHAIGNALQSPTFTRETVQSEAGQLIDQKLYVNTGSKQFARGANDTTQTGAVSLHVITGEVGTPTADYVKYDYVKTNQPNSQGKTTDFKSILGIWGTTAGSGSTMTDGQLYNQSVLGVITFGNLNLNERQELVKVIMDNKVYQTDYSKVIRLNVRGRPTYTYDVTVSAEAYITMLKKYASLVGLNQLSQVNSADYKGRPALKFKFVIDVWTNQITKISYSGNQRDEFYGGVGIKPKDVDLPKKTIPILQLQQQIQALE